MLEIQVPTNCPSCGSVLEWSNHLLYCRNPDCGSQAAKKLEHFAKTLKIKGLGPSTIEKLGINTVNELYDLTRDEFSKALNSDKLADKLFEEVRNSEKAPLNMVLPAFSIPLIGKTATEKLSTTCETIYDINEATCRQAGLGPKATENLLKWLKHNQQLIEILPFDNVFRKKQQATKKGVVCISGRLSSFKTKAEAARALEQKGYEVKSNLTQQVSILVNESGVESAKTRRARESGITIVTNLFDLIGED